MKLDIDINKKKFLIIVIIYNYIKIIFSLYFLNNKIDSINSNNQS